MYIVRGLFSGSHPTLQNLALSTFDCKFTAIIIALIFSFHISHGNCQPYFELARSDTNSQK